MKIIWNNFIGGLSVSKRAGKEGSYYRGYGIKPQNEAGVITNGAPIGEISSNVIFSDGDAILKEDWIMSENGTDTITIDNLDILSSGSEHTITTGNTPTVLDMATFIESGTRKLAYAYKDGPIQDIGIADVDSSLGLSSTDDDWFTNVLGGTLTNDPKLITKEQLLLVADGNSIHKYNASTSTLTSDFIEFPEDIIAMADAGNYIAIFTRKRTNTVYLWDPDLDNWSYEIPIAGLVYGASDWGGDVYFLVDEERATQSTISSNYFTLCKISRDLTSYDRVFRIENPGITVDAELIQNDETGYCLTSGSDGIYAIFREPDNSGETVRYFVFRYGGVAGLEKIATFPHYDTVSASTSIGDYNSNPSIYTRSSVTNDAIYFLDNVNNTYKLRVFTINLTSGGSSVFETIEKDVAVKNDNIQKGRAKKLHIFYRGAAASSADVSIVLDDTEYTGGDLGDSQTFSPTSPPTVIKSFNLPKKEFVSARVKIGGTVPEIFRMELEYDLIDQP